MVASSCLKKRGFLKNFKNLGGNTAVSSETLQSLVLGMCYVYMYVPRDELPFTTCSILKR